MPIRVRVHFIFLSYFGTEYETSQKWNDPQVLHKSVYTCLFFCSAGLVRQTYWNIIHFYARSPVLLKTAILCLFHPTCCSYWYRCLDTLLIQFYDEKEKKTQMKSVFFWVKLSCLDVRSTEKVGIIILNFWNTIVHDILYFISWKWLADQLVNPIRGVRVMLLLAAPWWGPPVETPDYRKWTTSLIQVN